MSAVIDKEFIESERAKVMENTGKGNSNFAVIYANKAVEYQHCKICYASLYRIERPEYIIADVFNIFNKQARPHTALEHMECVWNLPFVKKAFENETFEDLKKGGIIKIPKSFENWCMGDFMLPLILFREVVEYTRNHETWYALRKDGFSDVHATILAPFLLMYVARGTYQVWDGDNHSSAYKPYHNWEHIKKFLKDGDLPRRMYTGGTYSAGGKGYKPFSGGGTSRTQGFGVHFMMSGSGCDDDPKEYNGIPQIVSGEGFSKVSYADMGAIKEACNA